MPSGDLVEQVGRLGGVDDVEYLELPVTNSYTLFSGTSDGASWVSTTKGMRSGPVGPSACHYGSESSYVRRPQIIARSV